MEAAQSFDGRGLEPARHYERSVAAGAAPLNSSLVAQMRPALVAFFQRRCRNAAEAEDLAQDVMLRALPRGGFLSPERASGYIFRIAVNRWRDRGRRLMTHGCCVAWDDGSALGVSDDRTPERVVGASQELGNVVSALQNLGERTRNVLVMCRLESMKQADIAATMGISVSSVEKHLVRALTQLSRHSDAARSGA
jgi:RNA polymerase sigma-70 factor (ECF subfamily)